MADEASHPTRDALLEAGADLLAELTAVQLVAALRTREIARRAGVSPPTFFHHFPTVEAYAQALVEHVFTPAGTGLKGVVTTGLRDVAEQHALPAAQSIAYHTRDLHMAANDPRGKVRLGLWALGGPMAAEAHRRFLDEVDRQLLPQAQAFHAAWGREVRPPLDLQSYLALQLAILSGAAVRHLSDPTVMTPERYSRAAAALSMVLLRPVGDRRTMDDRLAEMNYAPAPGRARASTTGRRDTTRARILDAASELFGEYGYEAASVTQLARAAGVHVATLYDHFESKAHVGLALFDLRAEAHLDEVSSGVAPDALGALRTHLESVASLAAADQDLARLYLTAIACGESPDGFDDRVRRRTLALVEALVVGHPGDLDITRTTEHLLVGTIGAMLRHPGDGAVAAAATPLALVDVQLTRTD
jgi:AcrR family transcriptional regulator